MNRVKNKDKKYKVDKIKIYVTDGHPDVEIIKSERIKPADKLRYYKTILLYATNEYTRQDLEKERDIPLIIKLSLINKFNEIDKAEKDGGRSWIN